MPDFDVWCLLGLFVVTVIVQFATIVVLQKQHREDTEALYRIIVRERKKEELRIKFDLESG